MGCELVGLLILPKPSEFIDKEVNRPCREDGIIEDNSDRKNDQIRKKSLHVL